MGATQSKPAGPDLAQGIPASDLADGRMLAGHVEAALPARSGTEVVGIGASCTHYGGPLAEGLMVGATVRCPWHHACFSLRTGKALRAPAFARVSCWIVEQRDGRIFVRTKAQDPAPVETIHAPAAGWPREIVIVGGGAAGFAAAHLFRPALPDRDLPGPTR